MADGGHTSLSTDRNQILGCTTTPPEEHPRQEEKKKKKKKKKRKRKQMTSGLGEMTSGPGQTPCGIKRQQKRYVPGLFLP